jgi:hypothetical protein
LGAANEHCKTKCVYQDTERKCEEAEIDYQPMIFENVGGMTQECEEALRCLNKLVADNTNTPHGEVAQRFGQRISIDFQRAHHKSFSRRDSSMTLGTQTRTAALLEADGCLEEPDGLMQPIVNSSGVLRAYGSVPREAVSVRLFVRPLVLCGCWGVAQYEADQNLIVVIVKNDVCRCVKAIVVDVQKWFLSMFKSYVCRCINTMVVDVSKFLMIVIHMFMYCYIYFHYDLRMFCIFMYISSSFSTNGLTPIISSGQLSSGSWPAS